MNKTAACCLALSLYVFVAASYSLLPTLRSFVANLAQPAQNDSSLAILADASAHPTVAAPIPQHHPADHVPIELAIEHGAAARVATPENAALAREPVIPVIDAAPEATVLPPVQESLPAPALAPAVVLPTVTPTPQPVMVAEASLAS
ncbi:MAG TPA: hypothetical protein VNK95_21915, partial [Caldilineaceae bacterium]|nr:hypothetical protein [Caldilineaceae bacterium]